MGGHLASIAVCTCTTVGTTYTGTVSQASQCMLHTGPAHHVFCRTCTGLRSVNKQGVVTPICTILRAATGDCDPVYGRCRCGLPYYFVYYQKVTQSRWILRRSQGHQQFSSAVTRSQAVLLGRSQIVTPVAALSTAHIGVTTA